MDGRFVALSKRRGWLPARERVSGARHHRRRVAWSCSHQRSRSRATAGRRQGSATATRSSLDVGLSAPECGSECGTGHSHQHATLTNLRQSLMEMDGNGLWYGAGAGQLTGFKPPQRPAPLLGSEPHLQGHNVRPRGLVEAMVAKRSAAASASNSVRSRSDYYREIRLDQSSTWLQIICAQRLRADRNQVRAKRVQ
jgi:hypothetical protein